MNNKLFGKKLNELRNKTHTQAQLGELLGVGDKQIQRYENGLVPEHEGLQKLCNIYKYDFVSLIYDVPKTGQTPETYQPKYISLLELENERKNKIIDANLTGLLIGQKSILAHLAVGFEQSAMRDAQGDKQKAAKLKNETGKRIAEVLGAVLKKGNVAEGTSRGI